ncbi:hypothetical protein ACFJGX_20955 [Hydrogenophaga sp. UC242_50]|uniref:AbiU2 domain-containing protein n=1 Tax=Hydrogenophaga sp. UC242_50 TaxID=3350169 RepID=UPI0036D3E963
MASNQLTAEEARLRNVDVMGEELGSIYSQLWQELAWLYRAWAEYVTLFGTKESRVVLLNEAAPALTRLMQDTLWESVILHIARLTDPAKSMGKTNLSIRALEEATRDDVLKASVSGAVADALEASDFCRDWRNRRLAHRDLDLALKRGGEPLKSASRLQMHTALGSLSRVLNVLSLHYLDSTTFFDGALRFGGGSGGGMSLLYFLDSGLRAEEIRREQRKSGVFDSNDSRSRDL